MLRRIEYVSVVLGLNYTAREKSGRQCVLRLIPPPSEQTVRPNSVAMEGGGMPFLRSLLLFDGGSCTQPKVGSRVDRQTSIQQRTGTGEANGAHGAIFALWRRS